MLPKIGCSSINILKKYFKKYIYLHVPNQYSSRSYLAGLFFSSQVEKKALWGNFQLSVLEFSGTIR